MSIKIFACSKKKKKQTLNEKNVYAFFYKKTPLYAGLGSK